MTTIDRLAMAFSIGTQSKQDKYRLGTVKAVNSDGTVSVTFDGTSMTRCSCLYAAKAWDRVQVCIKANGSCVVLGKVGKR